MKKTHAPFPPFKNEQKKSGKEPCLLPPSKVRKNNKIFTKCKSNPKEKKKKKEKRKPNPPPPPPSNKSVLITPQNSTPPWKGNKCFFTPSPPFPQ